ncbi:MAG: hypothetical protein DRJ03_13130 [Chloroflexi bacterium]|nr:MAG: hypothetical protein DRJ03_13130 [Chloroflexota bacterium]
MSAKKKIEKALRDNDLKIGKVWKGYSPATMQNGWHRSNGQDWFLGRSLREALDTVERWAEIRSY